MTQRTAIWLAIALDLVLWALIVALILSLCACGGGGDLEGEATTIPVNCTLQPEICK